MWNEAALEAASVGRTMVQWHLHAGATDFATFWSSGRCMEDEAMKSEVDEFHRNWTRCVAGIVTGCRAPMRNETTASTAFDRLAA